MERRLKVFIVLISSLVIAGSFIACTGKKAELGTVDNPIKVHFVPSVDAKVIEDGSKLFKAFLEKTTPYKYEISMPQSFVAVVEAFGTKRADVAAINTFGYVLAHDKYGAEARMTVIRNGSSTYQSQFIAKADGPIKSIADLAGKKVAFVDPSSTSGYLLPLKTLKTKKIEPKETVFAMKHDSVVSMVYQGQVDGGATFYSAPSKDEKGQEHLEDARRLVLTQYPDVEKKIKILELSEPIPNDPIIFRKDMPEEMKGKIVEAIFAFVATAEGKEAFNKIYGVTEFKKSTDADYEPVRKMLNDLGKNAADLMKK
ncbi:MAG: phosphate/phosphite/phosphonate ABC transporter substrate-binding protein [Pseudobdellovibrionaceae bacterium]